MDGWMAHLVEDEGGTEERGREGGALLETRRTNGRTEGRIRQGRKQRSARARASFARLCGCSTVVSARNAGLCFIEMSVDDDLRSELLLGWGRDKRE